MPQNNIELTQSLYSAFARGDIASVLAALDPQVEWNEAENFIYADGNPYIGPQAVLAGVFAHIGGEWDNFSVTPEQIICQDDTAISRGRYRGTCKATGIAVNAQFVHVFVYKDGKIAKFQQYTDTAQFRDAAGRGQTASAS